MGVALATKRQDNAVHFTIMVFNQLYITNKMEHFNFKSGRPSSSKAFKRRLTYIVTVIMSD